MNRYFNKHKVKKGWAMTYDDYLKLSVKRTEVKKEEQNEQINFIDWLRLEYPHVITIISPIVKYSGSKWSRLKQGARIKAMGYVAGTLDIFIPLPKGKYHGLFIEMKKKKGGKKQNNQIHMAFKLSELGYKAVFCAGCEEAKAEFIKYIKG